MVRSVLLASTINYPFHPAQMIIGTDSTNIYFRFEVLFVAIEVGCLLADKVWWEELSYLDPNASYSLSLRLPTDSGKLMGFHSRSLQELNIPFQWLDHVECSLWIKPPSRLSWCQHCSNFVYYLKHEGKKGGHWKLSRKLQAHLLYYIFLSSICCLQVNIRGGMK